MQIVGQEGVSYRFAEDRIIYHIHRRNVLYVTLGVTQSFLSGVCVFATHFVQALMSPVQ